MRRKVFKFKLNDEDMQKTTAIIFITSSGEKIEFKRVTNCSDCGCVDLDTAEPVISNGNASAT